MRVAVRLAAVLAASQGEGAALGATLDGTRRLVMHYQPSRLGVGAILAATAEAGLGVADLSTEEADLEDIFIQLTSSRTAA